jgi:molybdate transport system substrate-binding protein
MRHRYLAIFVILSLMPAARADVLHVAGAGSLASAFTDLLRRFPAGPDAVAVPEFGPSGLMREKIEAGADVDLFASADMAQAERLAVGHPERFVVNFTRNRLCAIAHGSLGLTSANMLNRLLDPTVRLATSTPGSDPGGDYAWAVFARAEATHPGARAVLEAKALQLYGGGAKTPLLVPGKGAVEGIFLAERADVAFCYCSGAADVVREVPGLVVVQLPAELAVGPAYGMIVLDSKPVAWRFAMFVVSEAGQATLKEHGFDPVALVEPAASPSGILVQVAGAPARSVSPERIAGLPHLIQRVGFMTGHGEQQNEWGGPLLWDVLVDSGAVDPSKPADQVHRAVRITGADGYTAVVALAEIAPQFAGRPIQIADRLNGAPLPPPGLRLIVPGDRRGGRSVRDVVRIDIE